MRSSFLLSCLLPIALWAPASFAADEAPAPAPQKATAGSASNEVDPVAARGGGATVDPRRPRREGFTIELGLGAAAMSVRGPAISSAVRPGVAGLSLGIGGFVSRDVALTFRVTGAQTWADRPDGVTSSVLLGSYGFGVQYYLTDRIFAGGSWGLALLTETPLASRRAVASYEDHGMAGSARLGWAFLATRAHQLAITGEAMHAWTLGGGSGTTGMLALAYQYY